MTLVEELGALQLEIVQSDIALVITHTDCSLIDVDLDEGNIVEMGILRPR